MFSSFNHSWVLYNPLEFSISDSLDENSEFKTDLFKNQYSMFSMIYKKNELPPKKKITLKQLIIKILPYSAKKNIAKAIAEYSTL